MAEYCFTAYAIEGNKEILERVADAINQSDGFMATVIKSLGVKINEDEFEYYGRAEWETGARVEDRDGVSVLFFGQAYPWEHVDVIDEVLEQLGEPNPAVYFTANCMDEHFTNDEEGKYFPNRFWVTDDEGDDSGFASEEEAIAYLKKNFEACGDGGSFAELAEDLGLEYMVVEIL